MTAAEQKPATKPQPLRFSLRWLLGLLTLAAVLLAYPASIVRQAAHEAAVLEAFARHQPNVVYRAQGPAWLQEWLGEERCRVVHGIELRGRGVPKAIARLREFKDLQNLQIRECDLCDEHVEQIGVLPTLETLWLYRVSVTDRTLDTLEKYPKLDDVHFQRTQMSGAGIKRFTEQHTLHQYSIEGISNDEWPRAGKWDREPVAPTALDKARKELLAAYTTEGTRLPGNLRIAGKFNDGHLASFEPQDQLTLLELDHTEITDDGMRFVAALPYLERLHLSSNQLSDRGLANLAASQSLRDLHLYEHHVTAEGFKHLAKLPNLRALYLDCSGLRNDGIAALAACPKLEVLNLHGQNITSDALADIAKIKTLKELSLAGTNVSNRRIAELAKLPQLNRLNLQGTFVNENGALQLASMKSLGYLGVGGQFFRDTPAARQRLKQAFPKTGLQFRQ